MSTKIYEQAEKGVDMLWANDFSGAEKLLAQQAATNPRHALLFAEVFSSLHALIPTITLLVISS